MGMVVSKRGIGRITDCAAAELTNMQHIATAVTPRHQCILILFPTWNRLSYCLLLLRIDFPKQSRCINARWIMDWKGESS
jgi:hypothetical protein